MILAVNLPANYHESGFLSAPRRAECNFARMLVRILGRALINPALPRGLPARWRTGFKGFIASNNLCPSPSVPPFSRFSVFSLSSLSHMPRDNFRYPSRVSENSLRFGVIARVCNGKLVSGIIVTRILSRLARRYDRSGEASGRSFRFFVSSIENVIERVLFLRDHCGLSVLVICRCRFLYKEKMQSRCSLSCRLPNKFSAL
jgi:hypothetical protein